MPLDRRYLDEMLAAIADRDAAGIADVLGRQFRPPLDELRSTGNDDDETSATSGPSAAR